MELKKGSKSKIEVKSLEIHVSNHCNRSCKSCSHLSPLEEVSFIDIDGISRTLKILGKYLHCEVIRLLGGEPTLNRSLDIVVQRVKEIGISDKISIPTNGTMLNNISDEIINNINVIEISHYNYPRDKTEEIYKWCKRAKKINKDLDIYIYMYEYFREPCAFNKFEDKETIDKIYKTCIIAHEWQCFNVYENYLFKCPEAMAISKNINSEIMVKNGLKIVEGNNFRDKLEKYLFDINPLSACQYCLGSCGKLIPQ